MKEEWITSESMGNYSKIYQLSVELDKLIEEYYGISKRTGKVIAGKLIIE